MPGGFGGLVEDGGCVDVVDVLVAGGGPAGAATARRLALAGRSVVLVERGYDRPRIGETLAPSVQPLLRELGVWDRFTALGPLPSWGVRSVWADAEPAEHSHLASGWGSGWHVDRRAVDAMLADAAAAAGARVLTGATVTGCRYDGATWEVGWRSSGPLVDRTPRSLELVDRTRRSLEWAGRVPRSPGPFDRTPRSLELVDRTRRSLDWAGRTPRAPGHLRARVLVDATGRRCRVGRLLGGRRLAFDRLVAVAATGSARNAADTGHLLLEATDDGWWYTAPLPGGAMVAMLLTDADLARRHSLVDPQRWAARLRGTDVTAARLTGAVPASAPRVHPAASHRLLRPGDPRPWLAVGDAALAVDPLSGSGVVRALRTAEEAARTAARLLDDGDDTAAALTGYEAARDRECTAHLVERAGHYGLVRRFATPFWTRRAVPDAPAAACRTPVGVVTPAVDGVGASTGV